MRVALHTKVRADRVHDCRAAHRAVPVEFADAIRAAGASQWTIARWGSPRASAVGRGGRTLLDVVPDRSDEGADAALPVVGELP